MSKNEIPPDRRVALSVNAKTKLVTAGYTRKLYRFLLANGEVVDVDAIRDDQGRVMRDFIRTCPSCGAHHDGEPYDIGSGPEFNCRECDWCWGALGQALQPLPSDPFAPPDAPRRS